MKCDRCDRQATVHLIEIQDGKKVEKHLCEQHAVDEGVAVKVAQAPINDLLEKFVMKHSSAPQVHAETLQCEACGLNYDEFRKSGLLGCPDCYAAFEPALIPLLQRAHEGAERHLGKVPVHAGVNEMRQQRLAQLRRELEHAVASEQYERAAALRDQVAQAEADKS